MEKYRAELTAFIRDIYEEERKVLVFGEGPLGAKVMMIGEAPGEQESLQGRPFVGKAGKNLDAFLEKVGMVRKDMYVSNTVKFRPTRISDAGRSVNRPPTTEEIRLFLPWLKREIELVNPACIITLGNVPLKALTDRKSTIGDMHGRFFNLEGRRLYPMYHPASVIYNRSLMETYEADIEGFAAYLRGEWTGPEPADL
ncbi:MAG: uracil-DNA glycosylase [Clostridiales bacterium]|nr:uracil-DNA glycosylase [Clostridiales bacterium]